MLISVVVCTYNRAATLDRMLSSFFAQRHLDEVEHELVVVDNNSGDATRAVVERYLSHRSCHYCFEPRQGLSAARNRGVAEARGDVLAFLDDDVLVARDWLRGLHACWLETGADAIGGRALLLIEGAKPSWLGPFFRNLLSEVDFGGMRQHVYGGRGLWGVNLAFRKDALLAAGGFDERLGRTGSQLLGGEESALLERIAANRGRIVYEPRAAVEHIIGPERLQWPYFEALARSGAKTRWLREAPCGLAWQALRVLRTAISVAACELGLAMHRLRGSPSYPLRVKRWHRDLHANHLALRWRQLAERLLGVGHPARTRG